MIPGAAPPPRRAPRLFGLLSAAALVPILLLDGGFELRPGTLLTLRALPFVFVAIFAAELLFSLGAASNRRSFLRRDLAEFVVLGLLALVLLVEWLHPFGLFRADGIEDYLIPVRIYLVLNLVVRILQLFRVSARRGFPYARWFALSFLAIILVGTLLLFLLPGTKAEGKELSFTDALFTATSATCVTGLVTVDTGTHFSRFGQTIVLVLFQIGGLGLMTFAAFFALALGRGLGISERRVMRGVLNLRFAGGIGRVVVGILAITVLIEAVVTLILWARWGAEGGGLWFAFFHAASAFCNAGFSLNSDSLAPYVNDPVVNVTFMVAIVVGGLGFGVILDLLRMPWLGARFFTRIGLVDPETARRRPRLGVQTRIVLVATVALLVIGWGSFWYFEATNPETLGGLDPGSRAGAALFQSVTARTAGFQTIPVGEMRDSSLFLTVVLMIVGASPGSTGGGVKTVTTVVLVLAVIAFYRNRRRVEVAGRTLPASTVNQALVIVVSAFLIVTFATLFLVAVEGERHRLLSVLFEVGSAFGTVGLSTGITAGLTTVSKLVLCLVMLMGRIGPLSLVIALSAGRAPARHEYPEEHVMIG